MKKNDDEEKIDETDEFIKVTSMKLETNITHFESSHSRKPSKKCDRLSFSVIIESIISSFDRSSFFNIALFHDLVEQTTRENNREATTIIHLFHIITIISSLLEQSQIQERLISNEEWEIIKIVDKRKKKRALNTKCVERKRDYQNAS